jgi:hypothetical protein
VARSGPSGRMTGAKHLPNLDGTNLKLVPCSRNNIYFDHLLGFFICQCLTCFEQPAYRRQSCNRTFARVSLIYNNSLVPSPGFRRCLTPVILPEGLAPALVGRSSA